MTEKSFVENYKFEMIRIADKMPDSEGKHTVSWQAKLRFNKNEEISCFFFFPKNELKVEDGTWYIPRWAAENSYSKVFKRLKPELRKSLQKSYPEDREWVSSLDKRWLDAPFPKK